MSMTTALAYRVMVGASGFSFGLAMALFYGNVRDALRGDRLSWYWASARLGYAVIIIVLMPLIFQARNANVPWTWQSYAFMSALLLEITGLGGIYAERLRRRDK